MAMLTSIVCALGFAPSVPNPLNPTVPITAQTLGVMLAGGLLGAKRGAGSMLVFLAIVAVGAPVLSGGRGGLSAFVAPTAGYLWSFPLSALMIGFFTERFWNNLTFLKAILINVCGGIILVYAIGSPVLSFVTEMDIRAAFLSNVAYLPGDFMKAVIAAYIAVKMKRMKPIIEQDKTFIA
ncbi:biotin transporter BioY [Ammoniphilus oxalaticus]|nr:biotin transporter BioY [Ammoniphilus oxalaticus]